MKRGQIAVGAILVVVALTAGVGLVTARSALREASAGQAGAPGTPGPSATPFDLKRQTAPPGYTERPAQPRFAVRTAEDVRQLVAKDPFALSMWRELTSPGTPFYDPSLTSPPVIGTPVFVRALLGGQNSEWLLPFIANGRTVAVLTVSVDAAGEAAAGAFSAWEGAFPHPMTPSEASSRASADGDAVNTIELVWAIVSPQEGGPANELNPFYRAVRSSGSEIYVFHNGNVVRATQVHPVR